MPGLFTCLLTASSGSSGGSGDTEVVVDTVVIATARCLSSDCTVEANSTMTVNFLLNLSGEVIALPAAVEFDGGEIINDTLNFATDGVIDGDVLLRAEEYQFYPSRWTDKIKQGPTNLIPH